MKRKNEVCFTKDIIIEVKRQRRKRQVRNTINAPRDNYYYNRPSGSPPDNGELEMVKRENERLINTLKGIQQRNSAIIAQPPFQPVVEPTAATVKVEPPARPPRRIKQEIVNDFVGGNPPPPPDEPRPKIVRPRGFGGTDEDYERFLRSRMDRGLGFDPNDPEEMREANRFIYSRQEPVPLQEGSITGGGPPPGAPGGAGAIINTADHDGDDEREALEIIHYESLMKEMELKHKKELLALESSNSGVVKKKELEVQRLENEVELSKQRVVQYETELQRLKKILKEHEEAKNQTENKLSQLKLAYEALQKSTEKEKDMSAMKVVMKVFLEHVQNMFKIIDVIVSGATILKPTFDGLVLISDNLLKNLNDENYDFELIYNEYSNFLKQLITLEIESSKILSLKVLVDKESFDTYKKVYESWEVEKQDLVRVRKELQKKLGVKRKILQEKGAEIEQGRLYIQQLEQKIQEFEDQIRQQANDPQLIADLKVKVGQLEAERLRLLPFETDYGTVYAEKQQLEELIARGNLQVEDLTNRLTQKSADYDDLARRLNEMSAAYAGSNKPDDDEMGAAQEQLRSVIDELNKKLGAAETDMSTLGRELQDKTRELVEMKQLLNIDSVPVLKEKIQQIDFSIKEKDRLIAESGQKLMLSEKEKSELRNQIAQFTNQKLELENQNNRLRLEIAELTSGVQSSDEQRKRIQNLQNLLAKNDQDNLQISIQLGDATSKLNQLTEMMTATLIEMGISGAAQMDSVHERMAMIQENVKKYQYEIKKLNNQIVLGSGELGIKNAEIERIKKDYEQLSITIQDKQSLINKLNLTTQDEINRRNEMQREVEILKAKLNNMISNEKLDELLKTNQRDYDNFIVQLRENHKAELEELQKRYKDLEHAQMLAEQQIKGLTQAKDSTVNSYSEIADNLFNLRKEYSKKQEEIDNLNNLHLKLKNEHKTEIDGLTSKYQALVNKQLGMDREVEELKTHNQKHLIMIDSLEKEKAGMEAEFAKKIAEIEKLIVNEKRMTSELETLKTTNKTLADTSLQEKSELDKRIQNLEQQKFAEVNNLNEQIRKYLEIVTKNETAITELQNTIGLLNNKVKVETDKNAQLLLDMEAEKNKLIAELTEKKKKMDDDFVIQVDRAVSEKLNQATVENEAKAKTKQNEITEEARKLYEQHAVKIFEAIRTISYHLAFSKIIPIIMVNYQKTVALMSDCVNGAIKDFQTFTTGEASKKGLNNAADIADDFTKCTKRSSTIERSTESIILMDFLHTNTPSKRPEQLISDISNFEAFIYKLGTNTDIIKILLKEINDKLKVPQSSYSLGRVYGGNEKFKKEVLESSKVHFEIDVTIDQISVLTGEMASNIGGIQTNIKIYEPNGKFKIWDAKQLLYPMVSTAYAKYLECEQAYREFISTTLNGIEQINSNYLSILHSTNLMNDANSKLNDMSVYGKIMLASGVAVNVISRMVDMVKQFELEISDLDGNQSYQTIYQRANKSITGVSGSFQRSLINMHDDLKKKLDKLQQQVPQGANLDFADATQMQALARAGMGLVLIAMEEANKMKVSMVPQRDNFDVADTYTAPAEEEYDQYDPRLRMQQNEKRRAVLAESNKKARQDVYNRFRNPVGIGPVPSNVSMQM